MIFLICIHIVGHETQPTAEKLSSLTNQFLTPMSGSHKDVQVIGKSYSNDERTCFVCYTSQANSLPEGVYAEFRVRDIKATLVILETKRRHLLKPREM